MNFDVATFASSWAVRSTGLLLLGLLLIGLIRHASAARRHFVVALTFVALLLLPVFSLVLPVWQVSVLPPVRQEFTTPSIPVPPMPPLPPVAPVPSALPEMPSSADAVASEIPPPPPAPVLSVVPSPRIPWLLLAYGAGVVLLSLREITGRIRLARLQAESTPITDARLVGAFQSVLSTLTPERDVRLRTHPINPIPMTWGTLSPVVLLPADATEWSQERLRAVLFHEVAHIQRHDALTQALARLTCLLYWWHPGVWWLARSLSALAECACDDLVLTVGMEGPDYAGHLVAVVREAKASRLPSSAIAMGKPNALKIRIQAILEHTRDRQRVSRHGMIWGGLIAFVLLIPSAILHLRSSLAEPSPQTREAEKTTQAIKTVQPDYEPGAPIVAKDGVAILSNGVRISHLGTIVRLWSGSYQWNASGEYIPIAEPPSLSPQTLSQAKDDQLYTFRFLIDRIPNPKMRNTEILQYRVSSPQANINFLEGHSGATGAASGHSFGRAIIESTAAMTPFIVNNAVDVDVAFDNGKLIASHPLPGFKGKPSGYDLRPEYVSNASSRPLAEPDLMIRLRLPSDTGIAEGHRRVVAVDKDGKEHFYFLATGKKLNDTERTYHFRMRRDEATEIRVYQIFYQRIHFPSLAPSITFSNNQAIDSDKNTVTAVNGKATLPDGTVMTLARWNKGQEAHFGLQFPNRNDILKEDISYRLDGSDNPTNKIPRLTVYSYSGGPKVEAQYKLPLLRNWGKLSMQTWIASREWQTVEEYRPEEVQSPQARQEKGISQDSNGYAVGLPESLYGKPIRILEVAPDGTVLSFTQYLWGEKGETGIVSLGRGRSGNTIRIQTAPLYYVSFPVSE